MEEVMQAVLLVAELREETADNIKKGILPEQRLLEVMVSLLETVAEALRLRLNTLEWKQFYHNMHLGYITVDFCDRVQRWEEEALWMIRQNTEERVCNICKKKVNYLSSSNYFRDQQKKYDFPYWNAVFESLSRKHRSCPVCQSMDRERMISLFLDMLKPVKGEKLKVLHIAPSQALERYLRERDDIEHETVDLYMEGVSFNADIQSMPMIKEKTYDIIICSHILEHVADDKKAMLELKRILKEDGVCIFLVPLVIGSDKTDEAFGLSSDENWKRFGQDDHARLYGREDFLRRLIQSGYRVHILKEDYFGEKLWRQNGLSDIHCLYVASKKDIGLGVEPYQMENCTEKELVSVIIPTYNRGKLIDRSVKSVLNQTYKNLEVIVVDDASTDHTGDVIQKIEDPRVRYIRLEKNGGANHARNVGVRAARGKYVAFNDSDDEWLEMKLEKQMKLMCRSEPDIGCVYCMMTRYYNEVPSVQEPQSVPDLERVGENAVGDIFYYMQGHTFISTQMLLLKKEVIEEAGYFNEDLKRLQEWELLLRIAQKWKFTLVQESLVNVYVQKDRISANVEGLIDTIRYTIRLYDIDKLNAEAYEQLIMGGIVVAMKETCLPESYKEKVVADIEQDGVFSEDRIQEIRKTLGIGDSLKDK